MSKNLIYLIFFIGCSMTLSAQEELRDTSELWFIELHNRSQFVGKIKTEEKKYYVLLTKDENEIRLKKVRIKHIEVYNPLFLVNGKYYPSAKLKPDDEEDERKWFLMTRDKNEYIGKILGVRKHLIIMDTQVGRLAFNSRRVRYREPYDSTRLIGDEYLPKYKFPNQLSFTPSSEIGSSHLQINTVTGISGALVLNDKFTFGAGFLPVDLIKEERWNTDENFFWISAKYIRPSSYKDIRFGLGFIGGRSRNTFFGTDLKFGAAYGMMTFGNRILKANVGLGYGFIDNERFKRPVVTGSLVYRAGKLKFIHVEALMLGPVGGYAASSFRSISKNMAVDLGMIAFANQQVYVERDYLVLPYFKLMVAIGKKYRY